MISRLVSLTKTTRLSNARTIARCFSSDAAVRWEQVDIWFANHDKVSKRDRILKQVLENNKKNNLPAFDVSHNQGKLLALYVSILKADRVLEIGTLGGYSTIWMANALPKGGKLTTIEINPERATIAESNFKLAGLTDSRIEIKVGPATDVLSANSKTWLERPFSFVFIDADKANNTKYVEWALKLSRPGALIMVDNVVRDGAVLDGHSEDASVKGVQELCRMLENRPKKIEEWTTVQTVGVKGWDGYILIKVRDD